MTFILTQSSARAGTDQRNSVFILTNQYLWSVLRAVGVGAVAETYTVGGISDRTVSVKERRMVAARGRTSMVSVLPILRNWQQPAKVSAAARSKTALVELIHHEGFADADEKFKSEMLVLAAMDVVCLCFFPA